MTKRKMVSGVSKEEAVPGRRRARRVQPDRNRGGGGGVRAQPRGVVTARVDEHGRATVLDLLPPLPGLWRSRHVPKRRVTSPASRHVSVTSPSCPVTPRHVPVTSRHAPSRPRHVSISRRASPGAAARPRRPSAPVSRAAAGRTGQGPPPSLACMRACASARERARVRARARARVLSVRACVRVRVRVRLCARAASGRT